MATAKPKSPAPPRRPRWRAIAWLLPAIALGVLFWLWRPISGYATTGTAYGARVACSCRYVGGRSLDDCSKDFEPGMGLVTLSEDAEARSVTARFALLFPQTATFQEGPGCVLEKWND